MKPLRDTNSEPGLPALKSGGEVYLSSLKELCHEFDQNSNYRNCHQVGWNKKNNLSKY